METDFAIALAWISVALLAAGFAGERGRSRWNWFWICLLLGPIGVFILISWPRRERSEQPSRASGESGARTGHSEPSVDGGSAQI